MRGRNTTSTAAKTAATNAGSQTGSSTSTTPTRRRRAKSTNSNSPPSATIKVLATNKNEQQNNYQTSMRMIKDKPVGTTHGNSKMHVGTNQGTVASKSGLPSNSMSEWEHHSLQYPPHLVVVEEQYVKIRNSILYQWYSDVQSYLTREKALKDLKPSEIELAKVTFDFLNRFGYINIGLMKNMHALQSMNHHKKKIAIVGAGMSGIMAGHKLQMLGYDVTIFEARKRTGGRIAVDSNPNYSIDIGASIVTGSDTNPICTTLTKQTNQFHLHTIGDVGALFDVNGDAIHLNLDLKIEREFNRILDAACDMKRPENEEKRKSYLTHSNERLEEISLGQILFQMIDEYVNSVQNKDEKELYQRALYWHVANLEYGTGTHLDQCSLSHWDQDDQYEIGGKHKFVKEGYTSIINLLSKNLNIKLGQIVEKVEYLPNMSVKLHTKPNADYGSNHTIKNVRMSRTLDDNFAVSDSHEEQSDKSDEETEKAIDIMDGEIVSESIIHECDAVLITVPLGVLQKKTIKFEPALPDWKTKAIDNLGFGVLNKLILTFPYVFWDRKMDYFGSLNDNVQNRGGRYLFWNMYPCLNQPVLVALFAGSAALSMESENIDNLLSDAMDILRKIHGQHIPHPVKYLKTSWSSDPYATGTYSYIKYGSDGNDMDLLAKPVSQKVFFAGEATWRKHPSTVLGALQSGLREAGRIDLEFHRSQPAPSTSSSINITTTQTENRSSVWKRMPNRTDSDPTLLSPAKKVKIMQILNDIKLSQPSPLIHSPSPSFSRPTNSALPYGTMNQFVYPPSYSPFPPPGPLSQQHYAHPHYQHLYYHPNYLHSTNNYPLLIPATSYPTPNPYLQSQSPYSRMLWSNYKYNHDTNQTNQRKS